ncbi:LysE/ArgO family amino acid transporter [Alkalihalobacterium bogoriense]|uniref:LysE/ArgO family amino acid transporter n=1 Tax=Alkalihalobacterium bogoriense TaxID=246272 RepID=UPI00047B7C29|nr:LysE family transporter [Alkalihalobacterium bogoriense]
MDAFIHGFLLAFGLILPMGIQNIFIFNQGLTQPSYKKALPAIITASVCDTVLIIIAVSFLHLIADFFENVHVILMIGGFFFLLYIGWTIWHSSVTGNNATPPVPAKKQIIFALSVSLLNPHALLDTIGVIGTNSLLYQHEAKWLFMIAAIIVSWLYFFLLGFIGKIVGQLSDNIGWRKRFNQASALMIWGLAFYMLLHI